MSSSLLSRLFLFPGALALSSCSNGPEAVDEDEFFSGIVVPVAAGFSESDAERILEECGTNSVIVMLEDNAVRFEKSADSSVDTAACVVDRLISSGQPPLEDFPEPEPIGPRPEAN